VIVIFPSSKPTFARSRRFRAQDRAIEGPWQWQIVPGAGKRRSKWAVDRTATRTHAPLPGLSHASPLSLAAFDRTAARAGAGGARSRAINDRMSANICRGTATSAIWNQT